MLVGGLKGLAEGLSGNDETVEPYTMQDAGSVLSGLLNDFGDGNDDSEQSQDMQEKSIFDWIKKGAQIISQHLDYEQAQDSVQGRAGFVKAAKTGGKIAGAVAEHLDNEQFPDILHERGFWDDVLKKAASGVQGMLVGGLKGLAEGLGASDEILNDTWDGPVGGALEKAKKVIQAPNAAGTLQNTRGMLMDISMAQDIYATGQSMEQRV